MGNVFIWTATLWRTKRCRGKTFTLLFKISVYVAASIHILREKFLPELASELQIACFLCSCANLYTIKQDQVRTSLLAILKFTSMGISILKNIMFLHRWEDFS